MIPTLEAPDSIFVGAAMGWCELNAFDEAQAELVKLNPKLRNHPAVLEVRWHLCAKQNMWAEALQVADTMIDLIEHIRSNDTCDEPGCLTEIV